MNLIKVSNSMLSTFKRCNLQAGLRTKGYAKKDNITDKKLQAGKSLHEAFEAWMLGKSHAEILEVFRLSYKDYSDKFILSKDKYHYDNLTRILTVFLDTRRFEDLIFDPALDREGKICSEKQLEFELYRNSNLVIVFTSRIDGIVTLKADSSLWGLEDKTTGSINDEYKEAYELDSQIISETAALQANGFDVSGIMINVLALNKLPEPNAYKCKDHKIPQADCWRGHVHGEIFPVQVQGQMIKFWKEEAIELAYEYAQMLIEEAERERQVLKGTGDLSLAAPAFPYTHMQGLMDRSCKGCAYNKFCLSHRNNMNWLEIKPREEGIVSSGLYEIG